MRTLWAAAGLGAAAAALGVAVAGGTAAAPDGEQSALAKRAPRAIASRPTTRDAWTARVLFPVVGRAAPRRSARRVTRISPQASYNRGSQVLLVLRSHASRRNGVWYRLRLASRPNRASAWVPAQAVQVKRTKWRIKVDLSSRTGELYRAGRRVARWRVAVGASAFPTPAGLFAISEVVPQRNHNGFFGPAILTISAHSERLNYFDGGDGRAALHGTNRPGLLGTAASHGCVRFSNDAIEQIANSVPPGTPVDIVP